VLGGFRRRQSLGDNFANTANQIARHILRQQGDLGSGSEDDLAAVGLHLSAENPHEGRLAGPVASEQADPLARLNLAGNIVQQQRTVEPDPQFLDGD
jgi:hypothetical protein